MKLEKFDNKNIDTYIHMATLFHSGPGSCTPPNTEIFKKNYTQCLHSNEVNGFFIVEDSNIVGYILCSIMFSTEIGEYLNWIEELSILDEYQGKGYGSTVLELIEDQFPHVKRIRLEVAPGNHAAKKLYERLGYVFGPYEQMYKDITNQG